MKKENESKISKRAIPGFTVTPRDGYYQLRKIGLSGERVKNDPAFQRTRQQAADFAKALHLATAICQHVLAHTSLKRPLRSLAGRIRQAMGCDQVNPPGRRSLMQGNPQLLNGFEFNPAITWKDSIEHLPQVRVAPGFEVISINWPAMHPSVDMILPANSSYLRARATILTIDLQGLVQGSPWWQSSMAPVAARMPACSGQFSITQEQSKGLVLLIVSIRYYRLGRGKQQYPLEIMEGPMKVLNAYGIQ